MAAKRNKARRTTGPADTLVRDPESGIVVRADGGDRGPKERWQHGEAPVLEGGAAPHLRVRAQSMLDRYWQRRHIDARQFHAGRRLYRQWRAAGGERRLIASYAPRVGQSSAPADPSDGQAESRIAVTRALRAVGRQLNAVVVHVCLTDGSAADWAAAKLLPRSDGIARLRAGLDALADHYGMPGLEVRSQKSEVRDQMSEIRCRGSV
ncbi:MAG: hypothetical protein HKM95_04905 [Inquilinus sp.]|nr:hypothetical protein [Inquilinus sp.]